MIKRQLKIIKDKLTMTIWGRKELDEYYGNYNQYLMLNNGANNSPLVNKNILDLITIAFNNSKVIEYQILMLRKYLKDSFIYTVADNSSDKEKRKEIEKICKVYKVPYIYLPEQPNLHIFNRPSCSHGMALNYVYKNYIFKRGANYFGILDHDIFPTNDIYIMDILKKQEVYGLMVCHYGKSYLWPGYLFLSKISVKDIDLDFMPGSLDTGSKLYKIYEKYLNQKCEFAKIDRKNATEGNDLQINMYDIIDNWIHIINASEWKGTKTQNTKKQTVIFNNLEKLL